MIPINDFRQRLLALARPDSRDSAQMRKELEGSLTPLVRLALRKHVGVPALVDWVQTTFRQVSDGARPEQYTPQITRLLCAALLRETRPDANVRPPDRDPRAAW